MLQPNFTILPLYMYCMWDEGSSKRSFVYEMSEMDSEIKNMTFKTKKNACLFVENGK